MTDQDDNYESHEESEYQYSDDYTAEHKDAAPAEDTHAPIVAPLPRKNVKRMVVFGILFVGLVAIAYKIVAPSSSIPSTTITAAQVTEPTAPIAPNTTTASATPATAAPTPPAMSTAPGQVVSAQPATSSSGLPPSGTMMSSNQSAPAASSALPAPSQPAATAPVTPTTNPQAMPTTATGMPAVIPVEQPEVAMQPQTAMADTSMPPSSTVSAGSQLTPNANTQIASLAAQSSQLASQLQAEYMQKINEFNTQNKQLQTQVQDLNSRIGSLETELNHLVQTLEKQGVGGGSNNNANAPITSSAKGSDPKITFNVQAIIPGRAWLKSDNGETVTVAEGDVIRNLGKISKIDPYDGVVEINTGSKIVALSYGNGS